MSRLVQRILVGVVIGLVLMVARQAFAAFPPVTSYTYSIAGCSGNTVSGSSQSVLAGLAKAQCEALPAAAGCTFTVNVTSTGGSYGHGEGSFSAAGESCYEPWNYTRTGVAVSRDTGATSCPANSTGTTSCTCSAGYQENSAHNACEPIPGEAEQFCGDHAAAKNTFKMTGKSPAGGDSVPATSCYVPYPPFDGADAGKGCTATLKDSVAVPQEDGSRLWSSTGVFTGAVCSPASTPTGDPRPSTEDKCVGGFSGTVNGIERCVAAEPDKGIEGVKRSSETDADGTKREITETTRCEGTICTTTKDIKTTSPTGTVTNTTTNVTNNIEDKCAKDPTNAVCKKTGTGSGGATTDGGTCEESELVSCMKQGTPTDGEIPKTTKTLTLGTEQISGFSNGCPTPSTFNVHGRAFSVSYEPLCDSAGWIKPLILLVGGLVSMLIVYQAIKGA